MLSNSLEYGLIILYTNSMNNVIFLKRLTAVARGAAPADLVIKNSKIFDLFNGRIIRTDAAIYNDTIAGIGSYKGKKTIDAKGCYLYRVLLTAMFILKALCCLLLSLQKQPLLMAQQQL